LNQKRPRLKLISEEYAKLRRQVLERDGWRCQVCGCSVELQVHHIRWRSRLGGDQLDNLIVLCAQCHREQHVP
jgi:RNA-directed DNA polymerase